MTRKNFNIDAALRYYPVVKFIKQSRFDQEPILDVGSGVNGISDFLSNQVLGIDSDFSKTENPKNDNIKNLKGSITKLPVKDRSYNIAVCIDTFEHLSHSTRVKAIKELQRVVKRGGYIIISFPTGELSARFEKQINNLYKRKYGEDHLWLKEHIALGIPKTSEIVDEFLNSGIKQNNIQVIGNVNVFLWFLLHWLLTVHFRSYLTRVLLRPYQIPFNIVRRVNIGPYYRAILIIKNG